MSNQTKFEEQEMPKLKVGDLVSIFKDPQTETEFMGTAYLIEHVSNGLPFILEDGPTEAEQIINHLQKWKIKWDMVKHDEFIKTPWWFREDRAFEILQFYKKGL